MRSQHTDLVEEFFTHFQDVLSREDTRWDQVIMEEPKPERYLDTDDHLDGEIDLALLNGDEALVMEFKTSGKSRSKGRRQLRNIRNYLEDNGYDDVRCELYVEERNDHLSPAELQDEIMTNLGGFFSLGDLDNVIEYQRGWGSFGHLKCKDVLEDISEIDPQERFHHISSPYSTDVLEDRGILTSEAGKVYRFTPEYRGLIELGIEGLAYRIKPEEL